MSFKKDHDHVSNLSWRVPLEWMHDTLRPPVPPHMLGPEWRLLPNVPTADQDGADPECTMSASSYVPKVFTPKHIHASFELVLMPKKVVVWVNNLRWLTFWLNGSRRFEHPTHGLLEVVPTGVAWRNPENEERMAREFLNVPRRYRQEVREAIKGMQKS
jgi:hypothetical protein